MNSDEQELIAEVIEIASGDLIPTGDGLKIFFSPYDAAPYIVGPLEETLTKDEMKEFFLSAGDTHVLFGL